MDNKNPEINNESRKYSNENICNSKIEKESTKKEAKQNYSLNIAYIDNICETHHTYGTEIENIIKNLKVNHSLIIII